MVFKLGELFCGPGGLALGAVKAAPVKTRDGRQFSIKLVWGVDKDQFAIETFKHNFSKQYGVEAICMDAMEFCRKEIEKRKIDALAFGFPCNDFSLVGKQKGLNGKFGMLYMAGVEAVNKTNPLWFIAENVSGIHSSDEGKTFKKIIQELSQAGQGYVLNIHLYRFEEYGVPQFRHRYIIVGIRKDQNKVFKVPAPTHGKNGKPFITVKEELDKISKNSANAEIPFTSDRIRQRLIFIAPWQNAWHLDEILEMTPLQRKKTLQELPWYEQELAHLSDKEICEKIRQIKLYCTKAKMSHIYRRLHPDKPAYTITGSGGGGTHLYHWEEHRSLTNRERARLQTFPDNFEFKGSKEQVRKQIGMAVPPRAAKILFEAVLKTFASIDYPSVPSSYSSE